MKNRFAKLRVLGSKTNIITITVCSVLSAVILTIAVSPVINHIKIVADFATHTALAEKPKVDGVPTSGEIDLNDSGGAPQDGEALGTIKIAGTAVECTLYFGDDAPQLHAGAGIWTGGNIPGQNGTVLIAGHTNSFFRDLESVKEGADILVQTRYGEYHYRVTGTKIAKAEDTTAYDLDAEKDNLILYTCYPFGQVTVTNQRYFVYTEYVSGPQIKEAVNETK